MDSLGHLREFEIIRTMAKQSLAQMIHQALRRGILRGEIPPGHRLVEERLAREMGASRTPVREALQRLEQERLIEKLPRGGYEIRHVAPRDLEEIFGIRSLLESYAAALATRRIRPEVIRGLEAIIEESRNCLEVRDLERFIELNTQFHDSLYRASESERLCAMIQQMWDYFYRYRRVLLLVQGMPETSLQDHERMIRAMKEGDERAVETLVREHILRGLSKLLEEIQKGRTA